MRLCKKYSACLSNLCCVANILLQVSKSFLRQLYHQAITHSLPPIISKEVCKILVACTHRMSKVREKALAYAHLILETFSALLCDKEVVFTLLEILTLMRRSCETQYTDEVSQGRFRIVQMTDVRPVLPGIRVFF